MAAREGTSLSEPTAEMARLQRQPWPEAETEVLEALAALTEKYAPAVKYIVLAGDDSLLRQIAPAVKLPAVNRRLARHNEKDLKALLDEVYGFVCYRID